MNLGNALISSLIASSLILIVAVIFGIHSERKQAARGPARRAKRRALDTKAHPAHTPRGRARVGAAGGR